MDQEYTQPEQLLVDDISRDNLAEAARWAKFLAIMGFIGCGLLVLAGIAISVIFSIVGSISQSYDYTGRPSALAGKSAILGIFYIIGAVLYLFRCLYLYRFAEKMKSGLQNISQDEVNESFRNLKKLYRYNGIMTIVIVALYILILIVAMFMALGR